MNARDTTRSRLPRAGFGDVDQFEVRIRGLDAPGVLRAAIDRFGDGLRVATSFGAEDVVLIAMLAELGRDVRVFTLDTGRIPEETWEVAERLRARYGIDFDFVQPDPDRVAVMLRASGPRSMYASIESRRECCLVRKVEPLQRYLADASAWVTGLRRAQSVTRTDLERVELDLANGGLLKISPLADWSEDDVWNYIREHDVPFNRLHELGYPSIGCAPCTRAVQPGEDVRAGRWWWERPDDRECGLHAHAT
jgi:phosphoadenosine phosphosulfate reductase